MSKISGRSQLIPDMIARREPFDTYGSFNANEQGVTGLNLWQSGILSGYDLEVFKRDMRHIRYVVWSYSTPIAWWVTDTHDKNMPRVGHWHVVRQRFSVTTSKHQGRLYQIPGPSRWEPFFDASLRDDLACRRERGEHSGPVGYTDDGTLCQRHYLMRPVVKRVIESGQTHLMRLS